MAKIKAKINKEDLLLDLARRINANENGVRSYLQTAGISVDPGKGISLFELKSLRDLNEESFDNMIKFLYPEIFSSSANGDGGEGGEGSGLSEANQSSIIDLFKNLVGEAGSTVRDIYGSATSKALLQYSLEQAARTRRMLILLGVFIAIILIVWMVVRMRRANWSVMINK